MRGATLARDDSRMLSKSSLPSAYDGATARPCVTVKVEPSGAEKRPVDGVDDPVAKCVQVPDQATQLRHRNIGHGGHEQDELAAADLNDRHQSAADGADLRL